MLGLHVPTVMAHSSGWVDPTLRRTRRETIGQSANLHEAGMRIYALRVREVLAISLMFCVPRHRMLASMSATEWSDACVNELPTGTVTLLLADVEGSTRLWETQPDEMAAAVARLDQALAGAVAAHE